MRGYMRSQSPAKPACRHPDPALCARVGRHLFGHAFNLYHSSPEYRAKWEAEAAIRLLPAESRPKPLGFRRLPCIHEGTIKQWCHRVEADQRHVRDCDLHEECTRGFVSARVQACSLCKDYVPGREPFQWISLAKLTRDTIALAGRLPTNLAGVGGVPRSGMIPASILATLLHLPLWEVGEHGPPRMLRHGGRGTGGDPAGPVLVVDDTLYHGYALDRVRQATKDVPLKFVWAVVYVRRGFAGRVDLYHEQVPDLHVLEWNWANNGPLAGFAANQGYGKGMATDLDGIICHDHASRGEPGTPYMVPRKHPVPLICTGRRESDRPQTESWLQKHGVQWKRLAMLPNDASDSAEGISRHKVSHFVESGCGAFLESDPEQAELIHRGSGRPVICPILERVFQC